MFAGSLFTLFACSGGGDSADSAEALVPFACELGVPTEAGWAPLGTTLELELGFQGFVLAQLQVRAAADAPSPVTATMAIEAEGAEAVSGTQPQVHFVVDGDTAVSEPILAFFTGSYVSYYVGRPARVALRLDGGGGTCAVEGQSTLVDDDPCMHTGDEPICPDDSGDTAP